VLFQAGNRRGCLPGDLDEELVADGAEESLDLAPALGLTCAARILDRRLDLLFRLQA